MNLILINLEKTISKLDKMNKLSCNFCYLKNQSNIKSKIWKTPKVLIIQIKRFMVNDYNIPTQKLINKINKLQYSLINK